MSPIWRVLSSIAVTYSCQSGLNSVSIQKQQHPNVLHIIILLVSPLLKRLSPQVSCCPGCALCLSALSTSLPQPAANIRFSQQPFIQSTSLLAGVLLSTQRSVMLNLSSGETTVREIIMTEKSNSKRHALKRVQ